MGKLVCIVNSSFVKMYGVKINQAYNIIEETKSWWTIQVDANNNVTFAKNFNEFETLKEHRKRKLKKLWKQF